MWLFAWTCVAVAAAAGAVSLALPATSGERILSPQLSISWAADTIAQELHIVLNISVPAASSPWVGFGFGEQTSGSMPGSDIVTVWFDTNGEQVVTDRFAMGKFYPQSDTCQNWESEGSESADGFSVFKIKRAFSTGDTQDREISPGELRINYAHGVGPFRYHGGNRGAGIIHFYGNGTENWNNSAASGIMSAVFAFDHFPVPAETTTYVCKSFSLPKVEDAHIVEVRPIIETHNGDREFVHHMLVHVCEPSVNGTQDNHWDKYQTPGKCSSPIGDLSTGCISLLMGWAVGMSSVQWPPEAGFRIGNATSWSAKHIILEIHYDNRFNNPNVTDSSGIEIFYTTDLRKHDSAMLTLGDLSAKFPPIPPGLTMYDPRAQYEANCPSVCTSAWSHDIIVFGDFLHMHEAGASMFSTHWDENGDFQKFFNKARFYDFDFQQETRMESTIKRGDRINTHCWYDTSARTGPTTFGESSTQEMCMEFLSYYPRLEWGTKAAPYTWCGYIGSSQLPLGNATWCGAYDQGAVHVDMPNPTVTDPSKYSEIEFGSAPGSSNCGAVPTSGAVAASESSAPRVKEWVVVAVVVSVVLVICVAITVAVWVKKRRNRNNNYSPLR